MHRLLIKVPALAVFCLTVFASCAFFEERQESTLLAKAYNNRLYLEDLGGVFHAGISPEDSIAILGRHVDRWVQQQVMVHHALNSMPREKPGASPSKVSGAPVTMTRPAGFEASRWE